MATTPPVTPDTILADADKEIADADTLVASLEQAVQDGDESVDADQIEKARGLAKFARLRRAAAEKKAAELHAKTLADEFDAFMTENLNGIAASITLDDIHTELGKVADTIADLYDRIMTRNRYVYAIARRGDPVNTYEHTPAAKALEGSGMFAPTVARFNFHEHQHSVYSLNRLMEDLTNELRARNVN